MEREDPELRDVFEEAGVALPLKLEPELCVEGKELLLLAAEPVLLFNNREMAAGRAGSSDSVSASVISSSLPSTCLGVAWSREAPGPASCASPSAPW